MAGQGISYPPPIEDVPIFDSSLFKTNNTPLTIDEGKKYFLQYPNAQGTENLQITNVSGLLTADAGLTITAGDLTNKNNIIMNGTALTNYIQFPDGTQQFTAAAGGASNVISTQTIISNQNITFPAGTQFATIMISGAGGVSGGFYFDNPLNVSTAGGAGGAGGCAIIDRMPMEAGTNMICNITSGVVSVGYLPQTSSVYTNNTPLFSANPGQNGTTAVSTGGNPAGGVGGTIVTNFTGFGYGLQGATGGPGQQSSGTYPISRGINLLSSLNQNMFLSTTTPPFNYGAGGWSRINDGATGNVSISPPGGAVCIVISYSS